jgi:glutathione S-transferase
MNIYTLNAAINEAQRFIDRAKTLQAVHKQAYAGKGAAGTPRTFYDFPKDQAAVKRASMDLTRALADLRRKT